MKKIRLESTGCRRILMHHWLSFPLAPCLKAFSTKGSNNSGLASIDSSTSELGYDYRHYNDTTIYNKIREGFVAGELQIAMELKEQWGEAPTCVEVVSFLNEPSRYRLNLWAGLSLNLFQGLTLGLAGRKTHRLEHSPG